MENNQVRGEESPREKIHELKTWPFYFQHVLHGYKNFEVRKHDRPYKIGDVLLLKEWDNLTEKYTGREVARKITYILHGGAFGIDNGYCVLGLAATPVLQEGKEQAEEIGLFGWAFWYENDERKLITPQMLYEKFGLELHLTCGACPEQYEVFLLGTKEQVGYLRLRHGGFRVDYPSHNGETIYEAEPNGDGCFDDNERLKYLTEALQAIVKKTLQEGKPASEEAEYWFQKARELRVELNTLKASLHQAGKQESETPQH